MRCHRVGLAFLAASLFAPTGCGPTDTVTLQGCGATFPAPIYKRWFLEFYKQHPNVRTNYQAIGSGAGVQQFEEGLVEFGATDEALKEPRLLEIGKKLSEREKETVEVLQFPMTSGSVSICYNIGGDNPGLKLTRQAYIGMLLGEITSWDHPLIQSSNPGVTLPALRITFIRRADSSGTTFVFTNHLNSADPRWTKEKGGPGAGKTVPWPVGIGGKGNAGVAALIQQTPGAFGYVESGYAELTHLPMAAIENHAGNFVLPTIENCREGLTEVKLDKVLGGAVPDPKSENAYPMVSMTWVICKHHYRNAEHAEKLKAIFDYCLQSDAEGSGQRLSEQLGYIPLPEEVLAKARRVVQEIRAR